MSSEYSTWLYWKFLHRSPPQEFVAPQMKGVPMVPWVWFTLALVICSMKRLLNSKASTGWAILMSMVPLQATAFRFLDPMMQPMPVLPPEFLIPVMTLAYLTRFSPAGPQTMLLTSWSPRSSRMAH